MPFKPKIVRPGAEPLDPAFEAFSGEGLSDEALESCLPGDLEMLAGQLRSDASRLAELYPAQGVEKTLTPAARGRGRHATRYWVLGGTLALVLVAAVSVPWFLPKAEMFPTTATGPDSAATETDSGSGLATAAAPASTANGEAVRSRGVGAGAAPALFLQNVSGPELEGLFDLWEADSIEHSRISI